MTTVSSVLLVPAGAVNPRMGGGQRTALFFDALRSLGPVVVVLLGVDDNEAAVFFPGAEAVVAVPNDTLSTRPRSKFHKLHRAAMRISGAGFTTDTGLAAHVAAIVAEYNPQIVLTRYALPFARVGRQRSTEILEALDVDDRDDLKAKSQLAHYFGRRTGSGLGWLAAGVQKRLASVLRRADIVWFAKLPDVMSINGTETAVVPNVPFAAPDAETLTPAGDAKDILFVGTFGHEPNRVGMRWFLDEVWRGLSADAPEARLRVVGLGDWSSLAGNYGDLPRVDFVGTVDDLAPEYARARLVICPVSVVAGSQIKLIEACAHGRPVVSTPGAAGGFGDAISAAVKSAETPEAFAEACRAFLADPELATQTGRTLRNLQETEASRSALKAQIQAILLACLASRG